MFRRLLSALLAFAVAGALVAAVGGGTLGGGEDVLGGLAQSALAHAARPDAPTVRQASGRAGHPTGLPVGMLPAPRLEPALGHWRKLAFASPDVGACADFVFSNRSTRGPPGRDSFVIES